MTPGELFKLETVGNSKLESKLWMILGAFAKWTLQSTEWTIRGRTRFDLYRFGQIEKFTKVYKKLKNS